MGSMRALARRLAAIEGFADPDVALEQYLTPAEIAAHLVHLADLRGDLGGTVVDLGAGTGVIALGAALRDAERVVGIDRDPDALGIAVENEGRIDPAVDVEWLLADAGHAPLCGEPVTVLMNPPFGAQNASEGDRPFLATAARIADVSYSIHNAGSRDFVEAFVTDAGGTVTDAFAAELELDRQFPFHDADTEAIEVEVYRIDWERPPADH